MVLAHPQFEENAHDGEAAGGQHTRTTGGDFDFEGDSSQGAELVWGCECCRHKGYVLNISSSFGVTPLKTVQRSEERV